MAHGTAGRRWLAASAVGFEAGILAGEQLAGAGRPLGQNLTALLVALGVAVGGAVLGGLVLDRLRHPLLVIVLLVFGVLGVIFHGAPRAMVHVGYALLDADLESEAAEAALVSPETDVSAEAQQALAAAAGGPRVEAAITFMEAALWSPLTGQGACEALTRVEWRFGQAALDVGDRDLGTRWLERCAERSCETEWVGLCKAALSSDRADASPNAHLPRARSGAAGGQPAS